MIEIGVGYILCWYFTGDGFRRHRLRNVVHRRQLFAIPRLTTKHVDSLTPSPTNDLEHQNQIMIACFHDYPATEESSAFIFHSSMNDRMNSTVGNTVLHEMSSGGIVSNREDLGQRSISSVHCEPGKAIASLA